MFEGLTMTTLYTEIVRWVFVILALYILVRTIRSLLSSKNPAEVWAYMNLRTYQMNSSGDVLNVSESSMPITHWEM